MYQRAPRRPIAVCPDGLRARSIEFHRRGELTRAIRSYRRYLRRSPQDAGIWCNLGAALRRQGDAMGAVDCCLRALSLEPSRQELLGNLGNALKDLQRLDEAVAVLRRVAAATPRSSRAWFNLACALRERCDHEQALGCLDRAAEFSPRDPGITWERAQNLLCLGRYRAGFEAYEARWALGELSHPRFACALWRGESLRGKRILLHAEQGFGDTLLAARYIPLVKAKGAWVGLVCQPELLRVLEACGADRLIPRGDPVPDVDFHCPLMSLPGRFTRSPEEIPPPVSVTSDASAQDKFSDLETADPGVLRVGAVWSGSTTFKRNHLRALGLENFLSFADLASVQLYSLQQGPPRLQLQQIGRPVPIIDLADRCEDFADTAAALSRLDLVLMTDSSVAHLAGSLGVPVVNLLSFAPYWIYCGEAGGRTPWYPGHHLLRQPAPGAWAPVIERARTLIRQFADRKAAAIEPVATTSNLHGAF